jgi:methionyl-tRNA formyltransferase
VTTLTGTVLLAGFTARSKAYVQAMLRQDLVPQEIVLFGNAARDTGGSHSVDPQVQKSVDFFLPDLAEPLRVSCERADAPVLHCEAGDVNDGALIGILRDLGPRLVVYSGYGGQLVGPRLIDLGLPFLHVHAGWLPSYRGSTTVYYSWLIEGRCGATALLLDKTIDGGPVIARRRYSPPPPGVDVDNVYDGGMRADLLVDVLEEFARSGTLPQPPRDGDEGLTYYVIHPVLKHLALLSREPSS